MNHFGASDDGAADVECTLVLVPAEQADEEGAEAEAGGGSAAAAEGPGRDEDSGALHHRQLATSHFC